MADVGEIWHRARHDRPREQLERDPASVLSGVGLNDDEPALLDAALRQPPGPGRGSVLAPPRRPAPPSRESNPSPHPTPPGGELSADRKEHP